MCDRKLTGCQCDAPASFQTRRPLTDCVQQGPSLPVLPHGASEARHEVSEACDDVITAACQLNDLIGVSPDEGEEEHQVSIKYIHVLSAIAELTQAVVAYMEPDAGMEPSE